MGSAYQDVLSRMVLIVFSLSRDHASAARNELRFGRFANILQEIGFASTSAQADSLSCLDELIDRFRPDLVFSALDHLPDAAGRPVNVHGWLEQRAIPYVGSPPEAIELALDKTALKRKWHADGIATPDFLALDFPTGPTPIEEGKFPPFPCIVKPSDAGNSRGITKDSVVFDIPGLKTRLRFMAKEFRHILVEQYLGLYPDFREITCACVGNGPERLLMPAELVFLKPKGLHVITTQDKNRERAKARALTDDSMRKAAKDFARHVFDSAGVRDYSRCDLVFAGGEFWAIEVNGQPMIPDSWFDSCALYAGLDAKGYIAAIIDATNRRIRENPGARAELQ